MDRQWTSWAHTRAGAAGRQQGANNELRDPAHVVTPASSLSTLLHGSRPTSWIDDIKAPQREGLDDFDRRLLAMPSLDFQPSRPFRSMSIPTPSTVENRREPDINMESRPFPTRSTVPGTLPFSDDRLLEFPVENPGPRLAAALRPSEPFSRTQARDSDPFVTPPMRMPQAPNPAARDDYSPTLRCLERRQTHETGQSFSSNQKARPPLNNRQIQLDHAPPVANGIRLVSPRLALPDKFKHIFPYEVFNAAQSKCFPLVYGSNENLVVSSPTGSGKTAILELAICKLVADRSHQSFKIIYQAPTKALCFERAKDWESKFGHLDIHCAELTGDTSRTDMARVRNATIIVTTPEKWDAITRKWEDHHKLLQLVRLFLIDEVHILKDSRGATLEAVVSRMKTIGVDVRFVALSATVPNSEDIATWLGRDHNNQHLPAHRETFGEEMRPVKLEKIVYGSESSNINPFAFEKTLENRLRQVIQTHSEGKPIMIFCFTRKSCESTASMLSNMWMSLSLDDKKWHQPTKSIVVRNSNLQEVIKFGVAFHHAGLDPPDRQAVETGFLSGQISVICCTKTLAVGVNLPCHTVILKGTVGFNEGKLQEYSDLEVMQMLGRAGRPQFDTTARGIILTTRDRQEQYKKMLSGQEVLESTLHKSLIGHLNSEIVLQTIRDIPSAKIWLKGTFLFVRMRKNPTYYGISSSRDVEIVDKKIEDLCEKEISKLQEHGLVTEGSCFHSTEYGRAMTRYMVEFESMASLLNLPRGVDMKNLLKTLCHGTEFQELRFRSADRAMLKEINKSGTILFPIRDNLVEPWTKAFLLIQANLGGVVWPNYKKNGSAKRDLAIEGSVLTDKLQRLVRCVIDCKAADNDAVGTRVAMKLSRSLASRAWDGLPTELLQIPTLGPVAMRKLASQGVAGIREFAELHHSDIERIVGRNPPFGKTLLDSLKTFPSLTLQGAVVGKKQPPCLGESLPSVIVRAVIGYISDKCQPSWPGRKAPPLTFVAETTNGSLRFFWRDSIRKVDAHSGLELKFPVLVDEFNDDILLSLSCEEVVGTEVSQRLRHDIPLAQFPRKPARQVESDHRQTSERPCLARKERHKPEIRDEFTDPNISDQDLLGIAGVSDPPVISYGKRRCAESLDDELPPIESVISRSSRIEDQDLDFQDATRLHNGRWRCNHPCSYGVKKDGNSCSHRCCHEGLERPRKPPCKRKQAPIMESDNRERQMMSSKPKRGKTSGHALTQARPTTQKVSALEIEENEQGVVDVVDLSMLNDDDELLGEPLRSRTHHKPQACRETFEPKVHCDGRREFSPTSSHYGSDIFTDDDLPDLHEIVAKSQITEKETTFQSPEVNDTANTVYTADIDGVRKAQGGSWVDDDRYSSTERQSQLAEKESSLDGPEMVSDHDDTVGNGEAEARESQVAIAQKERGQTWPRIRQVRKEEGNAGGSNDEEYTSGLHPEWLAEIDPWVVNLVKGSTEFVA